jgi:hypothetical protein
VKRILVHQQENPIVNRLNKTRVEKHPDLKQEKDDRLKELRKRDQAAQQQRVGLDGLRKPPRDMILMNSPYRKRRKPD